MADAFQLFDSPGWSTLVLVLRESGERPPKRLAEDDFPMHRQYPPGATYGTGSGSLHKRVKGVSLS